MGQKTNPIGLRLGINKTWDSIWFNEKEFALKLHEDIILRNYIQNRLISEKVEYEETGWYNGKTWEKTLSSRQQDLLIAQHESSQY